MADPATRVGLTEIIADPWFAQGYEGAKAYQGEGEGANKGGGADASQAFLKLLLESVVANEVSVATILSRSSAEICSEGVCTKPVTPNPNASLMSSFVCT